MNRKNDTVPLGRAVAIIAIVVLLCLGLVSISVFLATARNEVDALPDMDVGISLNGTWQTTDPTVNNETITYIFSDNAFTMRREMLIFHAKIGDVLMLIDPGDVELLQQEADGVLMRTQTSGSFAISGNEIWKLVPGQNASVLPFSWEDDAIVINDDRFVRMYD